MFQERPNVSYNIESNIVMISTCFTGDTLSVHVASQNVRSVQQVATL